MLKEFSKKIPININQDTTVKEKRLTVIRNFTLEPFFDIAMQFYAPKIDLDYIYLEQSVIEDEPFTNDIFILLHPHYLMEDIYFHFYSLNEDTLKISSSKRIAFIIEQIESLLKRAKHHHAYIALFVSSDSCSVLDGFNTFESVTKRLNQRLIQLALSIKNLTLINSVSIAKKIGLNNYFDSSNTYTINSILTRNAINYIVHELTSKMNQNNLPIKCIILDCDNILWGGIIDEVGISGITLSNNGIGRAYREFQREILKLKKQGFIICICSKNEEQLVKSVFETNPYMLLKWDDLCGVKVSFGPKSNAISELSNDLNMPVQEMLFIDDSPYEIEEVSSSLPVKTVLMDPLNPHKYTQKLYDSGYCFKDFVSETDVTRTGLYRRVNDALVSSPNHDINNMLGTKINIRRATYSDLRRISELSLRTHQFNMSGIKYDIRELENLFGMPIYTILVMQAMDDYGDLGIVGAAIIKEKGEKTVIESFWLSCRVFGRNMEHNLIQYIIENNKSNKLYAYLTETEFNKNFIDFYHQHNIIITNE